MDVPSLWWTVVAPLPEEPVPAALHFRQPRVFPSGPHRGGCGCSPTGGVRGSGPQVPTTQCGAIMGGGGALALSRAANLLSPHGARGRTRLRERLGVTEPCTLAPRSGRRQACSQRSGFTVSPACRWPLWQFPSSQEPPLPKPNGDRCPNCLLWSQRLGLGVVKY